MPSLLRILRGLLLPSRSDYDYDTLPGDASSARDRKDAGQASSYSPRALYASSHRADSRLLSLLLTALAVSVVVNGILTIDAVRSSKEPPPLPPPPPPRSRVLLRTTQDNGAGIGSVIKQLQRSVVMGNALGVEVFAVQSFQTAHEYDTVGLINSRRETVMNNVDFDHVCKISNYIGQGSYEQLTDKFCEASLDGDPKNALSRGQLGLLKRMENCSIILQDLAWEVSPRLTKCTWKWLSRQFGHPLAREVPGHTSVGLHIRWGDMAIYDFPDDPLNPDRSIPIPLANAILSGLTICLGPLSIRLYMEKHNSTMLSAITHPYTLVDTRDDLGDLVDLSSNDVLVVSGSSYTTAAHQVSRGGLTFVPDVETHQERFWGEFGTNEVLKWGAVSRAGRDCEAVREAFERGRARSRAAAKEFRERSWEEVGLGGLGAR